MRLPESIINAVAELRAVGKSAVLVTIVRAADSAFSRVGTRMLVTFERCDRPQTIGTISGGCLDKDICKRAVNVVETGVPLLVRYDATSDADIVWNLDLGCEDFVELLLEPIDVRRNDAEFWFYADCTKKRQTGVAATIFQVEGVLKAELGARLLVTSEGFGTRKIKDHQLIELMLADARQTLVRRRTNVREYVFENRKISALIEIIEPPPALFVFGAGCDVLPIARLANDLNWQVTVVDPQARTTSYKRFAGASQVMLCRPANAVSHVKTDERTALLLMTHSYVQDRELLRFAIDSSAPYVGVFGPKKRTWRMIAELEAENHTFNITDIDRRRLYAPVSFDTGFETPEEAAVNIISEIGTVILGRNGGFLRDRAAPGYEGATQINRRQSLRSITANSELTTASVGIPAW